MDINDFDWTDSHSLVQVPGDSSNPMEIAGTCLKIFDYVVFLSRLSNEQLVDLKSTVGNAVSHELKKRL